MCSIALVLFAALAFGATPAPASLPLYFEPNVGQTNPSVRYMARNGSATLWLTGQGPVLGVRAKSREAVLKLRFEGANPNPKIEAEDRRGGFTNYFPNNDRSTWRTHVPQYGKVRYRDLYPGIDLVFYGNPQQLEYDFIVAPGADPSRIRMRFDGADRVSQDSGDLVVRVAGVEIRHKKPVIRQGEQAIEGRYAIHGKRAGFIVDRYDHSKELVIDPALTYLSYIGGQNGDQVSGVAFDPQGDIVLVGATNSPNFPIKNPLFKGTIQQASNQAFASAAGFVAKINPSASGSASLVWATIFGTDSSGEQTFGDRVAVDKSGNIWVAGDTTSSGFPLQNAFQSKIVNNHDCVGLNDGTIKMTASCSDVVVMKLSAAGDALLFSSYLGGSGADTPSGIVIDATGNIDLAGRTESINFPIRGNAHQSSLRGATDGWVSQISANGTLLYSTYVGGEDFDTLNGLAVDSTGNIWAVGRTTSLHAPTTPGVFQTTRSAGKEDAFVVGINPGPNAVGDSLVWGSYLGGASGSTEGNAIAVDASGKLYITGVTSSAAFPTTPNAIGTTFSGGLGFAFGIYGDAFVTILNPAVNGAAELVYSTYLGGSFDDTGYGIGVDSTGFVTVVGGTDSPDFPTTIAAFQYFFPGIETSTSIGVPGFITRFNPADNKGYSTFLGGGLGTTISTMALDSTGNILAFGGQTASPDVPVTASAFQTQLADANHPPGVVGTVGYGNGFFGRMDLSQVSPVILSYENGASLGADATHTIAPGLVFTIKGLGLGPDTPSGAQLDANGKISTNVAGVQVFAGYIPCPLTYVSSTQINAIAPYEIAPAVGFGIRVQSTYKGVLSSMLSVAVAATAPGILSLDDGSGQGVIFNSDGTLNGPNNPAKIGSIVTIYGTGEGQTNPPGITGGLATDLNNLPKPAAQASLTIGGVPVTDTRYFGTAPEEVYGLLQINAVVPAGVTPGGAVPVVLTVGGVSSPKTLTMAVSQ